MFTATLSPVSDMVFSLSLRNCMRSARLIFYGSCSVANSQILGLTKIDARAINFAPLICTWQFSTFCQLFRLGPATTAQLLYSDI